jgi:hypothetical protein
MTLSASTSRAMLPAWQRTGSWAAMSDPRPRIELAELLSHCRSRLVRFFSNVSNNWLRVGEVTPSASET